MSYFAFEATGRVESLSIGAPPGKVLRYRVLFLPSALEATLFGDDTFAASRVNGRLRIDGEFEDQAVQLAWQPSPGRGHYVMLSPQLLKTLGVDVGDEVTLRFNVVSPDAVALPETLAAALRAQASARALWAKLTPGQQRAIVARVASAKTEPTQRRRIEEAFAALARGERVGPPSRREIAERAAQAPRRGGAGATASRAQPRAAAKKAGGARARTPT